MDKELIKHIAQQLKNDQQPYVEGAWERFAEKEQQKKAFMLWPVWTAAAVVLIAMSLFFSINNVHKPTEFAKNQPQLETKDTPETGNSERDITTARAKIKANLSPVGNSEFKNTPDPIIAINTSDVFPIEQRSDLATQENIHLGLAQLIQVTLSNGKLNRTANVHFPSTEQKATAKKLTFEEILAVDSKKANEYQTVASTSDKKNNKQSKWQPGVFVGPSMGNNNKVNIDYGVLLSYNLAKKLAITSGVSYNAVSTKDDINTAATQTLSAKSLQSINANVRGINIPLELKYNITDKFYTGVGVSALAVLNSKQENNYVVNQFQDASMVNINGITERKTLIVKESVTEAPTADSNLDLNKYIGFYNFSFGYKQKLSKKTNLAVEPFLRLPMKTISRENLNLTNGGLRLKFDF